MSESKQKQADKIVSKPLIFRLLSRTVALLFLFLCALLLFFLIGNRQQFTDENQSFILTICILDAELLAFFSAITFLVSLFYAVVGDEAKRRVPYVLAIIIMIACAAIGAAVLILADSLAFITNF